MRPPWLTIARKEFADARRSRTLWAFVAVVAGGTTLGLVALRLVPGVEADAVSGIGGASQFASLLVPILSLVAAYLAVAGERESGTIRVLLGLPPSRAEVVAGKFLGRSAVVAAGVVVGFLPAAVGGVVVYGSFPVLAFAAVVALTALLGVVFVGVAVGLSAASATRSRAMTASVAVYLVVTLLWDLLAQGVHLAVFGRPPAPPVPAWYVLLERLSPTGAYETLVGAALSTADPSMPGLAVLLDGPVPAYLRSPAMVVVLVAWGVVPLALGYRRFSRSDLG